MIYDHVAGRLSELDQRVVAHVPPGGNWRDLPENFPSKRVDQIRLSAGRGEGSRSTYYGRLAPGRPSYTVSTYFNRPGNGCYIHPHSDRLITIREAARLQSFPDSFRFSGRGRARFLQVGNAVPPLLAYQVARLLPPGPVVDLFCGAGGMSLGFEWAGFDLVAAVDYDDAAVATMRLNGAAGDVALTRDLSEPEGVQQVVRHVHSRLNGPPSVVVGGPPCQGFSTAGKWVASDPRNKLVFAFLDAVEALRPDHVVMENVPALFWRRGRPTLNRLEAMLRSLGYNVEAAIMHAEAFGVPQLRRRLFLIASRAGEPAWPSPTHGLMAPAYPAMQPGALAAPDQLAPSVDDAIGDLPGDVAPGADEPIGYGYPAISAYQRWARGTLPIEELTGPAASVSAGSQLTLGAV